MLLTKRLFNLCALNGCLLFIFQGFSLKELFEKRGITRKVLQLSSIFCLLFFFKREPGGFHSFPAVQTAAYEFMQDYFIDFQCTCRCHFGCLCSFS